MDGAVKNGESEDSLTITKVYFFVKHFSSLRTQQKLWGNLSNQNNKPELMKTKSCYMNFWVIIRVTKA